MNYTQKVLTYKNNIVFEKIKMESFQRIPKLYVQNEACFMFVQKGSFSVRMPENRIALSKGQGFLAKCFDYFFEMSAEEINQNEFIEVVGVLLYPSVIEDVFQIAFSVPVTSSRFNLKKVAIDQLLHNFKQSIDILLENPELADDELVKTKLKEFVLLLLRTEQGKSIETFFANLFQKPAFDFKKTILFNLYSDLTLSELAHLCGMSDSTFKRKFKETFGESPIKFITHKKLEKAATLLASKALRISDIAYDCGFNDISSFNRAFKIKYNTSPSAYRLSLIQ